MIRAANTEHDAHWIERLTAQSLAFIAFGALWMSPITVSAQEVVTWIGECRRTNHDDVKATLVLKGRFFGKDAVESGTLNGRAISKIYVKDETIEFSAPGIYQGDKIIRRFTGRIDDNDHITGKLSQDDGKYAECDLDVEQ